MAEKEGVDGSVEEAAQAILDAGDVAEPEIVVEAESEAGADGTENTTAEADGAEKPKRGPHKRKDTAQLRAQLQTERSERERIANENADLRRQMTAKDTQLKEVDASNMANYEARIMADTQSAKRNLADAVASGDPEKIADATVAVSKAAGELGQLEMWKRSQPKAEKPKDEQRQQQQAQPGPDRAAQAWLGDNTWFNENDEMRNAVVLHAKSLEHRLVRQGKQNEIGSPTYYAALDKYVREEFPDEFDDGEEEVVVPRAAARTSAGIVTPTRASPTGQKPGKEVVKLSAEERDFAHRMAANGAIKGPNGKPLTHAEAEVRYATQKRNLARQSA